MRCLFFTSLILILHAYLGYPLSLYLLGFIRKKKVKKVKYFMPITMIITAYNEEKRIKKKLENTLAIRYPREKIQIILALDGSTDRTLEIASGHQEDGVEILNILERGGKENAQKEAVKRAKGDIIVFTDVATMIDPMGLGEIVANFSDPEIGCVSSEDRMFSADGKLGGEGSYVRYEMWLRRLESQVNSVVGLSGSFFAARKTVCKDFSENMQSDFRTLLNSVKSGLRGVCDPEAVGYYSDVSDQSREFERKVRTVLRGLTVFFKHLEFLNVFKYGLFSYQYFCHKLLRWLVPFFLCLVFITNLILSGGSYYFLTAFLLQLFFYSIAIWGWASNLGYQNPALKIPVYFIIVNSSISVAWCRYLQRRRIVMWTPSER